MVLLRGGGPKGAARIAASWADHRKVAQVLYKPDWTKHKNAVPFKRNDAMLETLPSASSCSRARASSRTSPTRPSRWAFRSSDSLQAARERRKERSPPQAHDIHYGLAYNI